MNMRKAPMFAKEGKRIGRNTRNVDDVFDGFQLEILNLKRYRRM